MEVERSCINVDLTESNEILSNEYIYDTLQKAINDIVKTERYVTYKVHKRIIDTKGDSFLGALCAVNIQGKTTDGDNNTHVFIKILDPDNQMVYIDLSQAYFNELYVYKELCNVYASLQEEFNIPLSERYGMVKLFNVCSQDVIALENMKEKGYVTYHRTEVVSLDFVQQALIELAKFHALSFALEHKRPKYFKKNIKTIRCSMHLNEEWENIVTTLSQTAIKLVDKEVEIKLVKFLNELTKKHAAHMEDENTVRCLCHGDYKASNILMKKINDETLKVVPIDYQLIYYGCPILDFLFFIFSSTDREFRRDHLLHLKDLYYNSLKKFLEHFNMKVETVYPRKEFERNYDEKLDYGLMISLILTPIMYFENDLVTLTPAMVSQQEANDECKRRLLGSIDEFIEWGYL